MIEGPAIIRSAWIGTVVFVVAAVIALAVTDARLPVVVVDLGLFFVGCGLFMWALTVAAARSRQHQIGLWSLFLLDGIAPGRVRAALLGALAVEIAVALGTAWVSAALAFGCLVPMWGLGHCGLWGARYGAFGPRRVAPGRGQPAGKE